ncbi:MAG: hypothetical protein IJR77_03080 [Bacteroidales bacterium]|nr:hypothetical protein [Bacteroidales bacterium]
MKEKTRTWILLVFTVLLLALYLIAMGGSARQRHEKTCTGLEVEIADSARLSFVLPGDVKGYLAEYGDFLGQRLDSVNLKKIEKILGERSAIRRSDAYVTEDGMLHVLITQRTPAVRFQKDGNGYYADTEGFIFPLQRNWTSRVPIVDGAVPLDIPRGYKGRPSTAEQQAWLSGILDLTSKISKSKQFKDTFSQITVAPGGDLVLIPREGRERFIFGTAGNADAKLGRIRDYYLCVAPSREDGYYGSVNVKYDGQIICKK